VYVRPGGDGDGATPATPYGSLTAFAIGALPARSVIALSRGTHQGPVRLARGITLWGACAAETALTTDAPAGDAGVVTVVGTSGSLRDLTVASSPRPGVWVEGERGEATLEGVVVDDAELAGVVVTELGRLRSDTVAVCGTRSGSAGTFGRGFSIEGGATATLDRAVLTGNRDTALWVSGPDTSATAADVVLSDTRGQRLDGTLGRGVEVADGATVTAERAVFEGNRELGAIASQPGTTLALSDLVVRRTEGLDRDGSSGRGVLVQLGAAARVQRAHLEHNREVNLLMIDEGTTASIADAVVHDTSWLEPEGTRGRGLGIQDGATADVTRALFADNLEVGVSAREPGTDLTLTDVVVRDTAGRHVDGTFGRGLNLETGATGRVTRALFERNRDVAVLVNSPGGRLIVTDTLVTGTLPRDCVETICPDDPSGHGIVSFGQARMQMSRFVIVGSALCGVWLGAEGELDLSDGVVRDQPIGLCLQNDGYDTARLTDRVHFVDNGVNLQATDLPVPEPGSG
jgi:hypothetical protein